MTVTYMTYGTAMCPADEYDDLELREEMAWHAIEGALAQKYNPGLLPALRTAAELLLEHIPHDLPPAGGEVCWDLGQHGQLTLVADDDSERMDSGAPGTVDLTATLTPA